MLMYPDYLFTCLHFDHGLLFVLILAGIWLSETSHICSFQVFSWERIGLQYPPLHGPVHTPDNNRWDTCIIEVLACRSTLCILEQMISNFINSVQISLIETLKLFAFSWILHWCQWQNVWWLMKKKLTVSWLSGLLSAEIFISTGEWGGGGGSDANTDRIKTTNFCGQGFRRFPW